MYSKEEVIFLKNLGGKLKKLRQERNLSQEGLAFAAELDRTYYSSVERGERNISVLNLHKISKAFNIPISELILGVK